MQRAGYDAAEAPKTQESPTAQLLADLRGVVAAAGGGATAATAAPSLSATSHTQLLLQLSALHKGFLALADALMEEVEAAAAHRSHVDDRFEGLRRELGAKLEVACQLQGDLAALAALDQGLHQQNSLLAEQVQELEAQVASLRLQVEAQEAAAAEVVQHEVTRALNAQLEDRLKHFEQERLHALVAEAVEREAVRWTQADLPALVERRIAPAADAAVQGAMQGCLTSLHAATEAATEAAGAAAADGAALAAELRQLTAWCQRLADAHGNHEQRVGRLEEHLVAAAAAAADLAGVAGTGISGSTGGAASAQPPSQRPAGSSSELAGLEARLEQVERRLQQLEARGSSAGAGTDWRQQQYQHRQQQQEGLPEAVAELHKQLGALAARQETASATSQELAHSMLTDVTALARHVKALDGEACSLRRAVERTQQAVLDSSAAFGKVLGIPPPVGPFTTFSPGP